MAKQKIKPLTGSLFEPAPAPAEATSAMVAEPVKQARRIYDRRRAIDLPTPIAADGKHREYRRIGPPGCGKTTWLATQCQHAAQAYGGSRVVVCSLTRAAAAEVAGRETNVPRENVGTLHAMARRALGVTVIAEGIGEQWNEYCATEIHQPQWRLSGETTAAVDDAAPEALKGQTEGDDFLSDLSRRRAMMQPEDFWPTSLRSFWKHWQNWKEDAGAFDFTDLIEMALLDCETAPGDPAAFFGDEAQDFSKMAARLLCKWGEKALRFIRVGDPDQCLYEWAGVHPENFFNPPLPAEQTKTLEQSYRVPIAVHKLAVGWINKTPNRAPVPYLPKPMEGLVRRVGGGFRDPVDWKSPKLLIRDAKKYLSEGKTVLFATTCGYMLSPVIGELRESGIPFHNPYRVTRGDWNPMGGGKGISVIQRIISFLSIRRGELWTIEDVKRWAEWLSSKSALVHGAKAFIKDLSEENETERFRPVTDFELESILLPESFTPALAGSLEWYIDNVKPEHKKKLQFPKKIIDNGGIEALEQSPQVIVSTIHGCKGGEADVVYLFPDLSPQAAAEWNDRGPGREGIRRAIYVGMTRAKETLVLCDPASPMSVDFFSRN